MAITDVTHESWLGRLGNSIKSVLVGIVLVAGAVGVLFWNEGRAVKRAKTIEEGARNVVSVGSAAVGAANEGKLVHTTGRAETDETLKDTLFGVSAGAIKLRRKVEMYQWEERKSTKSDKKLGGGTKKTTTYTYTEVWSERLIDSSTFKDSSKNNPPRMPFTSAEQTARHVTLGAFGLSKSLIGQMANYEKLPMTRALADALSEDLKKNLLLHEGEFYRPYLRGEVGGTPRVGDVRVSFHVVRPGAVSVIAKQVGETFGPYLAETGQEICWLRVGTHTAEAMFQAERESNVLWTWILRGAGFVAMLIGFLLVLRPIAVVGDVVPLIGSLLGAGIFVVSLVLSLVVSLITVAMGWLYYRPLVGIGLLAAAAAVFLVVRQLAKGRKAAATPPPPPPPQ